MWLGAWTKFVKGIHVENNFSIIMNILSDIERHWKILNKDDKY